MLTVEQEAERQRAKMPERLFRVTLLFDHKVMADRVCRSRVTVARDFFEFCEDFCPKDQMVQWEGKPFHRAWFKAQTGTYTVIIVEIDDPVMVADLLPKAE